MNRLFQSPNEESDLRPAFLSMAALMMLLLPTLLLAMSPQKLTGLPLSVPGPSEELPPLPSGPIERLSVQLLDEGAIIEAEIRSTDVRATIGDTERKQWTIKSEVELHPILRQLKSLDPDRSRITLHPSDSNTTADIVYWMDLFRSDSDGELFPKTVVDSQ